MKRAYIIICFVLVLMLMFMLWLHSLSETVYAEGWEKYEVRRGDTLYELAEYVNDGSYDTRDILHMIRERNDVYAVIYVGQVIEIPTGIKKEPIHEG